MKPREAGPDDAGGKLEAAILNALSVGPKSRGELVTKLKKPDWALTDALQAMADRGLVHREGGGPRNYKWHLGAKGANRSSVKEGH